MASGVPSRPAWESVDSAYENPGNLGPERTLVLKEFWSILLEFFKANTSLADRWAKLFPPQEGYPEEAEFVELLNSFTGESFRQELYGLIRHDYADLVPIRFLKARSFDKEKAMRMLLSALSYRRKNVPRAMLSETQKDPEFIEAMKKAKTFVPCYDDKGRTITLIRIANHSSGDCSQDCFERYTVYAVEHGHLLHLPHQDRTVLLVELTGFSIMTMDYSAIKFLLQTFESNYPEELSEGIIHNAPWLFGTAWSMIKNLLPSYTREKITFTSSKSELAAKIGKPAADRVLKAQFQYLPPKDDDVIFVDQSKDLSTASEACKEALATWDANVDEFEKLTQEWSKQTSTDEAFDARRAEATWELSESYWLIDEFIRPRSTYDRAGLLPPSDAKALNVSAKSDSSGASTPATTKSSSGARGSATGTSTPRSTRSQGQLDVFL